MSGKRKRKPGAAVGKTTTSINMEIHKSSSGLGHLFRRGRMDAIKSICRCLVLLHVSSYGSVTSSSSSPTMSSDCQLPDGWTGRWFHQGFPEPLAIGTNRIAGKGTCVRRNNNAFLMRESDPSLGECYRCMVIYEKHFNVLQYKESYCEERENLESMESLCNTIAGDAPLYSMFRKNGALIKCPFRGPFSFSYSKGDSGQDCHYPLSFMDTCSDNKRLQLQYQACHDVQGSESFKEEMSCLATWKEGSRRYLVSMMNHSHVYNDESRYRCFLYQRQRRPSDRSNGAAVASRVDRKGLTYKMAMSSFASCLGLWDVNEGYKTFNLKKLSNDNSASCLFPDFMGHHHDWHSVGDDDDTGLAIHLSKRGHSFKLRMNRSILGKEGSDGRQRRRGRTGVESHATCHKVVKRGDRTYKIVAHVKAGCDSGYVCLAFFNRDKHVIQMRYGAKSQDPAEACMSYYFDEEKSPQITMVQSGGHTRRPCPFSGRYLVHGNAEALSELVNDLGTTSCGRSSLSMVMHAGCSGQSSSSDLRIESSCQSKDGDDRLTTFNLNSDFICHGAWQQQQRKGDDDSRAVVGQQLGRRQAMRRQQHRRTDVLVVSTAARSGGERRKFLCLTYTELDDGMLSAYVGSDACNPTASSAALPLSLQSSTSQPWRRPQLSRHRRRNVDGGKTFNISSSGPCLQALTGEAVGTVVNAASAVRCFVATLILSIVRWH